MKARGWLWAAKDLGVEAFLEAIRMAPEGTRKSRCADVGIVVVVVWYCRFASWTKLLAAEAPLEHRKEDIIGKIVLFDERCQKASETKAQITVVNGAEN